MRASRASKFLAISIFVFVFSLENCTCSKDVIKLPQKGSFIVFQDKDGLEKNDYKVINTLTNKYYRWQPKTIKNYSKFPNKTSFNLAKSFLNPDGVSYKLPIPKKSKYFDLTPDRNQVAYILNSNIHIMNTDGSDPMISKYKGSRLNWLTNKKLAFTSPSRSSIFIIHKGQEDLANPFILASKPYITQIQGSPDGKQLMFTTRAFRSGGYSGVVDLINTNGEGLMTIAKPQDIGGDAVDPQWSPDGKKIALRYKDKIQIGKRTPFNLLVMNADGTHAKQILKVDKNPDGLMSRGSGYDGVQSFVWSPDGKKIAFIAALENSCRLKNEAGHITCHYTLYTINADGTNLKKRLKLKLEDKHAKRLIWIDR